MVHICFNYSFYNSLKVAMNHEIIMDGFIEQRTNYQRVQVVDKSTGVPKTIIMP